MAGSAPGSGQISPVRPAADGGPGTGLGAPWEAAELNPPVQADPSEEVRNWLEKTSPCLEKEGKSRSVVYPLGPGEEGKARHTGQTSQNGCPDRSPHGFLAGSPSHWELVRRVPPLVPQAELRPTVQMLWEN